MLRAIHIEICAQGIAGQLTLMEPNPDWVVAELARLREARAQWNSAVERQLVLAGMSSDAAKVVMVDDEEYFGSEFTGGSTPELAVEIWRKANAVGDAT